MKGTIFHQFSPISVQLTHSQKPRIRSPMACTSWESEFSSMWSVGGQSEVGNLVVLEEALVAVQNALSKLLP